MSKEQNIQPGNEGLGHDQQNVQDLGPLPDKEKKQPEAKGGKGRQPGDQIAEQEHNVQDDPGAQQDG